MIIPPEVLHWLVEFVLAGFVGLLAFIAQGFKTDIIENTKNTKENEKTITELKEYILKEYVPKNDYKEALNKIEATLLRIMEELQEIRTDLSGKEDRSNMTSRMSSNGQRRRATDKEHG